MKKTNFFKIVMTLVMAFAMNSVFAQILTDYVSAESAASESVDSVITGTTTTLYVYPDLNYSPDYDASLNNGLGADAQWTWYNGTDATGTEIQAAANDNSLTQAWGAAGTYSVAVVESNTAFACTGAAKTMDVEILAEPTYGFTADGTPYFGTDHIYCENEARLATDAVQVAFSNSIAGNSPSIYLDYILEVDTTHSGGTTWTNIGDLTDDNTVATTPVIDIDAGTYDVPTPAGGFVCVDDGGAPAKKYTTRYTYTFNGITDRITRKCDYPTLKTAYSSLTWYDTGAKTITITVNPTPVTGPIYHISNMWAN